MAVLQRVLQNPQVQEQSTLAPQQRAELQNVMGVMQNVSASEGGLNTTLKDIIEMSQAGGVGQTASEKSFLEVFGGMSLINIMGFLQHLDTRFLDSLHPKFKAFLAKKKASGEELNFFEDLN